LFSPRPAEAAPGAGPRPRPAGAVVATDFAIPGAAVAAADVQQAGLLNTNLRQLYSLLAGFVHGFLAEERAAKLSVTFIQLVFSVFSIRFCFRLGDNSATNLEQS
jgi:hypothetical protein